MANQNKMIQKLTHNFAIKIICFLAAASLWVYVSASQNAVAKFPSSIPIKVINAPSGLVAVYDQKTVDLKIMAEPSVWRQLSNKSFSAYIDLSGATEGTFELPLNVVCSVPNVTIAEKTPSSIIVSLEPIITKDVTINKKIEGNAGEGLVAGNIDLTPDKVSAKGAKSLIDNLNEATVIIGLNGETEDFSRNVPVVAIDEKGEIISDISFNPEQVKAEVPIVRASNNKTVGIKVVVSGVPKNGSYLSSIVATPSTVDITGPSSVLSSINYIETYGIDLSTIDSTDTKDVNLNLPDGIALQAGLVNSVKVKIILSNEATSREMTASVLFQNLASNLRVSSQNPSQIKVVVTGDISKINDLGTSDVVAQIDLSGKSSGNYSVSLSPLNIKVPDGIFVASITPSALIVVLENQ
ncbi:MAG: CdaR family protein [Patescibacteria group bacterium]